MMAFSARDIRLELLSVNHRESYLAALAEMVTDRDRTAWVCLGDNVPHDTPAKDFAAYVARLRKMEIEAQPNFVKRTCYWAIYNSEMVGRISIRPELDEEMGRVGGHIGYIVRPSFRRRGVATEMLRQLLETEQARAIGKVLLTCRVDNVASERTIVRNGGVLESIVPDGVMPDKKRFWIYLSTQSPPRK